MDHYSNLVKNNWLYTSNFSTRETWYCENYIRMKVKTNNSKGNEREAISRQDSFKICRKQKMDEILAQMGATAQDHKTEEDVYSPI